MFIKEKKSFLKGVLCGVVIASVVMFVQCRFNIISLLGAHNSTKVSKKAEMIAKTLENNYIEDLEETGLDENMYTQMVAAVGDEYTKYCTVDDINRLYEEKEGSISGIGAFVKMSADGKYPCVYGFYENSPAEKAGLLSGDIILTVDGTSTENLDLDTIVNLIKGEIGTSVNIEILRGDEKKELDVTRAKVNITYVYGKLDGDIGYIQITEFMGDTAAQFKAVLDELQSHNIKGLIIDLRNNPGGSVDEVVKIADMLLPEGLITYTEDRFGNRKDYISNEEEVKLPIAVLVNEISASASELLSGALQSTEKGIIVGTQTYGKGIVQSYFLFSDGSGVKATVSRYFTPDGVCIQGVGITPDYVVESDNMDADENDKQYMEAVRILKTIKD
ncbi:putative CtpA-like serine protease [Clostridiales bacterium]|nr:putative CtpA-like serine protease [Clostridiales bacterium]